MPHTHTVWLFDGTYINVDESRYPNGIQSVEEAMVGKTAIFLGDSLVAGSSISRVQPFGNRDDYGSARISLSDGIDRASVLLDERHESPNAKERIDQIKDEMRKKYVDPSDQQKKAYAEEVARYRSNGNDLTPDQRERMEQEGHVRS